MQTLDQINKNLTHERVDSQSFHTATMHSAAKNLLKWSVNETVYYTAKGDSSKQGKSMHQRKQMKALSS